MANIHYLVGNSRYKMNKYLSKLNINLENLITYDFSDDVDDVAFFDDISSSSLFSDAKYIVAYNINLIYSKYPMQSKRLIDFLESDSDDVTLIIQSDEKIDSIAIYIKNIIFVNDPKGEELEKEIVELTKENGYKIERNAIITLIKRTNENIYSIINYLSILYNLDLQDKNINLSKIDLVVPREIEDKIYELTSAILKKDKKTMRIFNDLMVTYNKDVIKLLNSIARTTMDYILLEKYIEEGLKENEIATKLGYKNSGRLYYMQRDLRTIDTAECKKLYKELANLDFNFKSTNELKEVGLDLAILNYIRK